jgi:hypothetical protein
MSEDLLLEVPTVPCHRCGKEGVHRMVDLTDGKRVGMHDQCLALEAMEVEDIFNKAIKRMVEERFPDTELPPHAFDIAGKFVRQAIRTSQREAQ